jgi:hypothetical protein
LSNSESQALVPQLARDGFLPSRSARDLRTERYFTEWLTDEGIGSTKRKGRIQSQFPPVL